jgi:hypothetical protein
MPTPLEQSLVTKFNAAKDTFVDGWKVGTHVWLQDNAPQVIVKMMLAEQNLDTVWAQAKTNPGLLPFFDAALETWKQTHHEGIKAWQARSGQ